MFESTFSAELAKRVGSRVEVATDNNLIEGVLGNVTPTSILVINVSGGYGPNTRQFIETDAINFVRFPVVGQNPFPNFA
ncbi:MAG TPA: hypothetical protein VK142_07185 [Bacillota bacterium]|nr:hypothetical protein [Bacillota bacterium]